MRLRGITEDQLEIILEIIDNCTEYEVEVQGYRDFAVTPSRNNKKIMEELGR